ncbi:MAG: YncE family protein [Bacteroides sp.]|nr:YncE family protein [Bacteroides sp.]
MKSVLSILLLLLLSLPACMKDENLWDFDRLNADELQGVFVVNEGNFTYGNASLSFYNMKSGELINDIFYATNALPLGDVALSMTIRDSLAYVVVNNSGRIYVINTSTFQYVGKITGLTSPRYLHFVSDTKAYVSDLYGRSISIINPLTLELTGSIDVSNPEGGSFQHSTEQMLQYGKYVYTNCWSFDNKVLVIDSERDEVLDSIEVLKQPNSMVLDRHHNLWVLSDGGFEGSPYGYETPGLMKVEAGAKEAVLVHRFESGDQPTELHINGSGDTLWFLNRHLYRLPLETGADPEPELFVESPYAPGFNGGFYGLDIDPSSSELYISDAVDFVQRGLVYRYAPNGASLDTLRVGISPAAFCFKP